MRTGRDVHVQDATTSKYELISSFFFMPPYVTLKPHLPCVEINFSHVYMFSFICVKAVLRPGLHSGEEALVFFWDTSKFFPDPSYMFKCYCNSSSPLHANCTVLVLFCTHTFIAHSISCLCSVISPLLLFLRFLPFIEAMHLTGKRLTLKLAITHTFLWFYL